MGVPETQEEEEAAPDIQFASEIRKDSSFNTDAEEIAVDEIQSIIDDVEVEVNNDSAFKTPIRSVPHPAPVHNPCTLKVVPVSKTPTVIDKAQVPNALHTPQRETKTVMTPPQITLKGQRKPAPTRIRSGGTDTAVDVSAPRRRRVTRQIPQDAQQTKLPTPVQLPKRTPKRRANFVDDDGDEPQLPALEQPVHHAPAKKLRTYKKGPKK